MNSNDRKQKHEKLDAFLRVQFPTRLDQLLRNELNACKQQQHQDDNTSSSTTQPVIIDTSSRVRIWILNEFAVANNLPGHSNLIDRSNAVRCKYGHLKTNDAIYKTKNAYLNFPIDPTTNAPQIPATSPHLSLDILPDLFARTNRAPGDTFECSTSHIHGFYAFDTEMYFSEFFIFYFFLSGFFLI